MPECINVKKTVGNPLKTDFSIQINRQLFFEIKYSAQVKL